MRKLLALFMAIFLVISLLFAAQAVVTASSSIPDSDLYAEGIDRDEI